MDYLSIRNGNGKGVYKFNTNGEKSRILSKFSGCSTRVFPISMLKEACEWAGVEKPVSEDMNNWAITRVIQNIDTIQPIVQNIENKENIEYKNTKVETTNLIQQNKIEKNNINREKENDTQSMTTNTNNDTQTNIFSSKHIPTDFEHILEIYKKLGSFMLKVTMTDGEELCVVPDIYWYFSKDARKYRVEEKVLEKDSLNCLSMKDIILKDAEIFRKNKTGPKNPVFGEIISPEMFATIPKTKYLAFGNLIYFTDCNFYSYEEKIDENKRIYLVAKRNEDKTKLNITINVNNIKNICIIEDKQKISTREFTNLLKKLQKEREKDKTK